MTEYVKTGDGTPNDKQVGGTHYKTTYEHWDFCEDHGLGCMEYQATKHVTRHKKKLGLEDVAKARHYVLKLIELVEQRHRVPKGHAPFEAIRDYNDANNLSGHEAEFIRIMAEWNTVGHLNAALQTLNMIESTYAGG